MKKIVRIKYLLIFTAILGIISSCCKPEEPKEPKDYRDKYVGIYDFTTNYSARYNTGTFDGIMQYDTIQGLLHFIGSIEKHESNKLKIIFKPNGQYYGNMSNITYPFVDEFGNLSYPQIDCCIVGFIINNNIKMVCGEHWGHARFEEYDVHGIKINKK